MDGLVGKLIGILAVLGLCAVVYVTLNQGINTKTNSVITEINKPQVNMFNP